jgi:hypothetical protein
MYVVEMGLLGSDRKACCWGPSWPSMGCTILEPQSGQASMLVERGFNKQRGLHDPVYLGNFSVKIWGTGSAMPQPRFGAQLKLNFPAKPNSLAPQSFIFLYGMAQGQILQ